MAQNTAKKSSRKGLIALIVLIAAIAMFAVIFAVSSSSSTSQGEKLVSIVIVDKDGIETYYSIRTDAEYLREVMDECAGKGLTYSGTESEYGMYVETINGVTADYSADGAYWAFYVRPSGADDYEYCNYGIDSQPVQDGEVYSIEYTIYSY